MAGMGIENFFEREVKRLAAQMIRDWAWVGFVDTEDLLKFREAINTELMLRGDTKPNGS